MADLIELFGKGQDQFGQCLRQVKDDQWDNPTPCSEWTVRDVAYHVIDEQRWVAPLLAGKSLEEAGDVVASMANTDPVSDWEQACALAHAAVGEPGVLDQDVSLSRGATPATQYITEMAMDATIHSWDLGAGIGAKPEPPADLSQFVYDTVLQWGDLSAFQVFAPAVSVGEDAPLIDRLVGYTGRDPGWQAS